MFVVSPNSVSTACLNLDDNIQQSAQSHVAKFITVNTTNKGEHSQRHGKCVCVEAELVTTPKIWVRP